ncbi:CDP-alcohol phosphatidyltransferase family protein [Petrimonas sp.]|uniref:CDP-alcohol phosphatidyltransferase family protein n=1 Tax=Petrimonas sp. TaxID=2023866 RepID=UPI003F5165A8
MKPINKQKTTDILKVISSDRERTNILKKYEQQALAKLVQYVPLWMTSNILTGIGFFGNVTVGIAFVLGYFIHPFFLLLGILGFAVNWLGDSLDGRLAYYRNKPRKWFGFSLDVIVDWIGIVIIGLGFTIYMESAWKILGFIFVVLYGWEMIIALLRYKVTGKYLIDSNFLGPTELRLIISGMIILEVIFPGSIAYLTLIATVVLLFDCYRETVRLLELADVRDKNEKKAA